MKTKEFFEDTPIFAMLHLAGKHPIRRALEELTLFEEEGIDGVIVENYHGNIKCVEDTLGVIQERKTPLKVGVNVLPNDHRLAFYLAKQHHCSFVQLDYVAGNYTRSSIGIDAQDYLRVRRNAAYIFVLGGVWPKYYTPVEGSHLENDLREGMERADAIVVTGEGTGMETPLHKIKKFREVLGTHPLIVGAGLSPDNAREQLLIADGAIVGSWFKEDNETENQVHRRRVQEFMSVVRDVRKEKSLF